MAAPIVRQALYLEVADRLRDMIRSHALASGQWIDEVRLTEQLGISRTPLREALKVLANEGLVRLEPRRGSFVNELAVSDLEQIFPLMAMLEGRCAYEAAQKATAAELQALGPLHESLREQAAAGRVDDYYDTNYRIHVAVQALADNRWLSDMVDKLRKVVGLFRHKSLALPGRLQESCAEHLAIYAALQARDPEGLRRSRASTCCGRWTRCADWRKCSPAGAARYGGSRSCHPWTDRCPRASRNHASRLRRLPAATA